MFFIKGTYQNELLNRSFLVFIDFYVAIFAASVIMDWIYNNNNRSILSGVLVHFCINFFGELLELPDYAMYFRTAAQIVLAVIILVSCSGINGKKSIMQKQQDFMQ
jgi:membrane protease YdiL (CAAX protease family)